MLGLGALLSAAAAAAVLEGFAQLPADQTLPGPMSGHFIEAGPALTRPFVGQPAQGFSDIAAGRGNEFFLVTDNGFGSKANSADFLLRIYSLTPDFRTAQGGSGEVLINGFINLSDPYWRLGLPATMLMEHYTGVESAPLVDASIRNLSLLTGADLDPESMVLDADGSFWIGDEFGPFLLRFNAAGELLEPPYGLNRLASPDHPGLGSATPVVRRSRGFEGLARSADSDALYAWLEGPLANQEGVLNVYRFNLERRSFEGSVDQPWFRYRLDDGATAVGAVTAYGQGRALVIERDSGQGQAARVKKVYLVQFEPPGEDGLAAKQEVADLLRIEDPHDLNRDGSPRFAFSHHTPESILVLDDGRLLIVNDNNYPFGRARDAERADPTEFIVLRVEPLP